MSVVSNHPDSRLIIMTISSEKRSISPVSPREAKGIRLFRAIGRKLVKRYNEDLNDVEEPDSRSSSSDSCSSTTAERCSRLRKDGDSKNFRTESTNHMSSSSSESGSEILNKSRNHLSTSAESIRKVFQNLNLQGRSHSCTNTKDKKKSKKPAPKRILRQPVTYTYVKGLSGLPTQRIPKNSKVSNNCGCSVQYMSGLNR